MDCSASGNRLVDWRFRRYVLDHVIATVEVTTVEPDPYPHFIAHDFLPQDVYSDLLDCVPTSSEYEPFGYWRHSDRDGQSNRRRFRLVSVSLERLPRRDREFWYTIRSALGSIALKECVFNQFSCGLSYRFGCEPDAAQSLPGFALPELIQETEGYRIKPHPDTRKKVVTLQLALPADGRQIALGTQLYRRSLRPASWFREPKGFDIVKSAPFLPNTALAFVVLNTIRIRSWHGRSTLPPGCGVRNSLLNIWYASPEHANREILQEQWSPSGRPRAA